MSLAHNRVQEIQAAFALAIHLNKMVRKRNLRSATRAVGLARLAPKASVPPGGARRRMARAAV